MVEVGAGTGRNFGHYPPGVTEVIAVEPEPRLRRIAEAGAATVAVDISVVDGVASRLPLEDGSCDIGVASLVLCSVRDQDQALEELRRVIRPGGELRFYEHVAAEDRRLAQFQRLVDRLFWPRIGGGCHSGRDTLAAIQRAGFVIDSCRPFRFKPSEHRGDAPNEAAPVRLQWRSRQGKPEGAISAGPDAQSGRWPHARANSA